MTKHSLASVLALSFSVMYAEEAPVLTLSNTRTGVMQLAILIPKYSEKHIWKKNFRKADR